MEEWTVTYDKYMLEKLDYIANYIANELDDAFGAQKSSRFNKKRDTKTGNNAFTLPPLPIQ